MDDLRFVYVPQYLPNSIAGLARELSGFLRIVVGKTPRDLPAIPVEARHHLAAREIPFNAQYTNAEQAFTRIAKCMDSTGIKDQFASHRGRPRQPALAGRERWLIGF